LELKIFTEEEKQRLFKNAIDMVYEGGKIANRYFKQNLIIENKAENSFNPVTVADRSAEKKIREMIEKLYPNDSIVGEEYGKKEGSTDLTWIIDPIDGTKAFISGIPTWGILLSLLRHKEPILGIIYQPFTNELFWGGFGQSFKKIGLKSDDPKSIGVRKCENIANAVVATSSPNIPNQLFQAALTDIMRLSKLDRYGLDCYAYAMLADGSIDAVIEFGLQEYDIRAPEAIVLSAGGIISNLDGSYPLKGGDVIASGDPRVHTQIVEIFNK
jgi:histidinol phosphatase-like enzyme (inositol monophosphatase family)